MVSPLSTLGSVLTIHQFQSRRPCRGLRGTYCTPEGPPPEAGTLKKKPKKKHDELRPITR